jgi:hypothetical protein
MAYIAENGWHFNKKACEEAVRMMKRKGSSGKPEPLEPWSLGARNRSTRC